MELDTTGRGFHFFPWIGDALLLVNVQNDFLPDGALSVPGGDQILPLLNEYMRRFSKLRLPVFATRDWHPMDHFSFQTAGGPWPPHCIAGSFGAAFPAGLALPDEADVISKASMPEHEAYSGFAGTDLAFRLRKAGIRRIFVGGLATDYCVLNTVKDACALGFDTVLLVDAVRAVELHPGDGKRAIDAMLLCGARQATLQSIAT